MKNKTNRKEYTTGNLIRRGEAYATKSKLLLEDLQAVFLYKQKQDPQIYEALELHRCGEMVRDVQQQIEDCRRTWSELSFNIQKIYEHPPFRD